MTSFELAALNKSQGTWRLLLEEENATLLPSEASAVDDTAIVIPRSETAGHFDLAGLWGGQAVLVLPKKGKRRKLQFRLDPGQHQAVDQWIGPRSVSHLRLLLRRRYALTCAPPRSSGWQAPQGRAVSWVDGPKG